MEEKKQEGLKESKQGSLDDNIKSKQNNFEEIDVFEVNLDENIKEKSDLSAKKELSEKEREMSDLREEEKTKVEQKVEDKEREEENQDDFDDDDDYYVDEDEIQVQEVEPAIYEVETKIGTGELYSYLMMHTYSSFSGKVCVILSLLALIMLLLGAGKGDMTKTVILGIVALLYTVINPIMLYMKAARQAKLNPAYKDSMKFGFHEKGVNISFGGNEGMIPWDKMMKAKKTKKVYALYTDPIHAFLIATKDLRKTGSEIESYMEEHMTRK